ncbi:MBOAT family O-acyltransferase [Planctomycetota bacterium]
MIDYVAAIEMAKRKSKTGRRAWLFMSLAGNLGLLFAFKYLNFTTGALTQAFQLVNMNLSFPYLRVLLPVGISFYTFQTLSYTLDVYRGTREPERHLGIFALYVSFFPQLVAGPIERSTFLLPQLHKHYQFDYDRVVGGLQLMLWGFFKKLVIADRLAVYVDQVYNNPGNYQGIPVILASYFFAFQIYCDFSGYSDIAIGSAQIMGIQLTKNFDRPYFSKSLAEFWQRWHITLSSWFKNYVYFSLGGNRCSKAKWLRNIIVVFFLSGLWHGANWTFLAWGLLHGIYLIMGIYLRPLRNGLVHLTKLNRFPKLLKIAQVTITFHLVVFAWVLFRSKSLQDVIVHIRSACDLRGSSLAAVAAPVSKLYLIIALSGIVFMEVVHLLERKRPMPCLVGEQPLIIRWAVYNMLFFGILFFGVFGKQEFIYFQF